MVFIFFGDYYSEKQQKGTWYSRDLQTLPTGQLKQNVVLQRIILLN